jgi:hypothetical protein
MSNKNEFLKLTVEDEPVGSLYYDGEELVFSGDAHYSAKLFFEEVCLLNNGKIKELKAKVEEMQAAIAEIWRDYKGWHYELQSLEKFLPEKE